MPQNLSYYLPTSQSSFVVPGRVAAMQARRKLEGGRSMYPTVWPSGIKRWLHVSVRKGVGSNPTAVILCGRLPLHAALLLHARRSCDGAENK